MFSTIYNYLEKTVQAKRRSKRKISLEAELEIYDLMRHFVDEYFGRPNEPVDMTKVKKLAANILEDLKNKGKVEVPGDLKHNSQQV